MIADTRSPLTAIDMLEKMLVFDPKKRIDATNGLAHEYVSPYHDASDEPIAAEPFDWSFNDADLPVDTWKVMMYSEILGRSQNTRDTLDPLDINGALADFHQVTEGAEAAAEGPITGPDTALPVDVQVA